MPQFKKCRGACGRNLSVDETNFYPHVDGADGFRNVCRECCAEENRARRARKEGRPAAPKAARSSAGPQKTQESFSVSGDEQEQTLESYSHSVRTVEEVLRIAKVDEKQWRVESKWVNKWEVAAKVAQADGTDKLVVQDLWQVKCLLRRKPEIVVAMEATFEHLFKKLEGYAPQYPRIIRSKSKDPYMLEVCLFDAHFGKLAWGFETNGDNYDLRIAERVYLDAVKEILDKASHYHIERIIFPIGQDFFHVNNASRTTAKGTPQDTDGRLPKIFPIGCEAVITAIEYCLACAPVEVPWVPGNHDPDTSFFLAEVVKARFHKAKDVKVDSRPTTRKIIVHGENGICFTHGDEEPHRDLPTIMAAEEREMWGRTSYNEVHVGHFHKRKQVSFVGADTFGGGVVVRTIPSLSSADAWHYRKGWARSPRSAEAFMWGTRPGLEAYFCANAQPSSPGRRG